MNARGATAGGGRTAHDRLFEQLYRRHAGRGRAYALRLLRSAADADEVTQDAFLRLYRADLTAYEDPARVLYRTLFRLALNRRRADRCNPLQAAAPLSGALAAPSVEASAEERLLSREREDAYRRALAVLPPRCREVIELRTVQELSYKEMASRLGVAVSTLEKHASRGRRLCIEAMAGWHADRPMSAAA